MNAIDSQGEVASPKPPVTRETLERQKRTTTLWLLLITFFALVGGALYSVFGPNPPIKIGYDTTRLTTPLAADGFPDYAAVLRADMSQGVTPENNGAIPFLEVMWPDYDENFTIEDGKLLCKELGIDGPPSGENCLTEFMTIENRKEAFYILKKQWRMLHPEEEREASNKKAPSRLFFEVGEYDENTHGSRIRKFLRNIFRYDYLERPWSEENMPFLAKWISKNNEAIDQLVDAVNHKGWYLPSPEILRKSRGRFIGDLDLEQKTVGILLARSNNRLSEARCALALQDAIAILNLANHVLKKPSCWAQERGQGFYRKGLDQLLRISVDVKSSGDVRKSALLELSSTAPKLRLIDAFDLGYRYLILDGHVTEEARSWSMQNSFECVPFQCRLNGVSTDWNVVLRDQNRYVDAMIVAASLPTCKQQEVALWKLDEEFFTFASAGNQSDFSQMLKLVTSLSTSSNRGKLYSYLLGGWGGMFNSLSSFFTGEFRSENRYNLTRISVALEVYLTEKEAYPKTLEQLVPTIIAKLPVDSYHQKPFQYQPTKGGYLLYSFGPNGVDDKGSCSDENWHIVGEMSYEGHQYYAPTLEEQKLLEEIPASADDPSIRMPLPVAPWPWENM